MESGSQVKRINAGEVSRGGEARRAMLCRCDMTE